MGLRESLNFVGHAARVVGLPVMLAVMPGCEKDPVADATAAISKTVEALQATGQFHKIRCDRLDIDGRRTIPESDGYGTSVSYITKGGETRVVNREGPMHRDAEVVGTWSGHSFESRANGGRGHSRDTSVCVGLVEPIQRRDRSTWSIRDMEIVLYQRPVSSTHVDVGADVYANMRYDAQGLNDSVYYFGIDTLNTRVEDFPQTVMQGFPCSVVGVGDTRLTGGQPCKAD